MNASSSDTQTQSAFPEVTVSPRIRARTSSPASKCHGQLTAPQLPTGAESVLTQDNLCACYSRKLKCSYKSQLVAAVWPAAQIKARGVLTMKENICCL